MKGMDILMLSLKNCNKFEIFRVDLNILFSNLGFIQILQIKQLSLEVMIWLHQLNKNPILWLDKK